MNNSISSFFTHFYEGEQLLKLSGCFPGCYGYCVNSIALRKAKIVYNFGLSECNRVNQRITVSEITNNYLFSDIKKKVLIVLKTNIVDVYTDSKLFS